MSWQSAVREWGRHVDTMICKVQLKIDGSAMAREGGEGKEKAEEAGAACKAHMWHRRQEEDWGKEAAAAGGDRWEG